MTRAAVDPQTRLTQAEATDPRASAWVAANAGSGKTFVLARRVIRLLLAGVDPARILCLTFTKAAAAEMANRVFAELGRWTTLPDAALAAEIAEIDGHDPGADTLALARRLFAKALDTPGGLKIQTIHAFCERLLHQFPLEANVAGHFDVLDERDAEALAVEARRFVLARAASEPDGLLGHALREVLSRVSDRTHEDSLAEFVRRRDEIGAWSRAHNGMEGAVADLKRALGVERGETVAALRARVIAEGPFDAATAKRLVEHLGAGSNNDRRASERLRPFVTLADPEARIDAYLGYFFKKDGEPYAPASLATAGTTAAWPGLGELLGSEMERLVALLDRIRTADVFESSVAMLALADAAIGAYERQKQARGALDFEDLIVRTVHLLRRSDASAWVHYKLDRGLDHILVDEAQDTSPRQWQVVRYLAEEFFTGESANTNVRTLFGVGDEKQSIYSFQGAVPAWFALTQQSMGEAARAGNYLWRDRELHLSFRSAPIVLQAVDEVFRHPSAHQGLTAKLQPTAHTAIRRNDVGRVILWPPVEPPDKPEPKDWVNPVDYLGQDSPEVMLAKRIAATVTGWLARGEHLDAPGKDGKPKPIRPGGILVLLRYRGALADAIIRELKGKGVPIAGADRLALTEHIAIMDLMALGRVVLLPEDDLSLAALLKSPLIGLDEDALFALAAGRGDATLWDTLWRKAAEREDFAEARALIDGWRAAADWRDPHAFFARILAEDGRRAFLARLGPEADDILDEFLTQALAYERNNVPTLEGFLAWLVDGDFEVKRDTDFVRDEVRVMTVHGAKGLEADVVFLIDNGTLPHAAIHDPKLLSLAGEHDPDTPGPFVWKSMVKRLPLRVRAALDEWRQRAEEEYRRLLYVGMTRARDRLIVAGIDKGNVRDENDRRWHKLVREGLGEGEMTEIVLADGTAAQEWRAHPGAPAAGALPAEAETAVALPAWAGEAAPESAARLRKLTPSAMAADEARPARATFLVPEGGAGLKARERGKLVHRLLESLPDIAPEHRAEVGARYLAAAADGWSEAERASLLAEVLAILGDSRFADAFAPGSRAEVEIAGRMATKTGEAAISGRIDRLAVAGGRILIVDYKTNRPAPKTLAEVPETYVRQLALYRVALRTLYPGKIVAAALLWTDGPGLMEIPDDMLNRAESDLARR